MDRLFLILPFSAIFFLNVCLGQSFLVLDGDTLNRLDVDSVKHGLWREFYKSTGNIKSEVYYLNGKKEGLELIWYNIPHCLQYEAVYKNGLLDGPVKKYSRWCNLESEENYKNGLAFGYQRKYYPNGSLKTEANFKNGVLLGTYKTYDKNGDLLFESKEDVKELQLNDSVKVSNVALDRILNPNSNQSDKLIVTDITGSMYPYVKQVINWYEKYLKTNSNPLSFVFFNDGDKKPQVLKTIGNTGGVYCIQSNNLSEIVRTMTTAAKNGGGGDLSENNVEAILTGLQKFPKTQTVIMIADNTAPVRDIQLVNRIKKPVRIILCALDKYDEINPDFILIAYLTKGSLHTFESDIYDFSNVTDDEVIELRGVNYLINKGTVVKL